MHRMLKMGAVLIGAVSLAGAFAVPAGAGKVRIGVAPLTIEKEVDGRVPEDTEFTVTVNCSGPIIFTGPTGPGANSAKVDFDNEGDPDGSNVVKFIDGGTCTVTETEDGDAEDVSYECEGSFNSSPAAASSEWVTPQLDGVAEPCASHGPQEAPITVFIESESQTVTVTVTNEFPDPEPVPPAPAAQAVAVSPTFTG
jgi:uncharacterized protein DUF5979